MTENTNRAELLDKVRELFAISPITSSPKEAAIAAREVRKLMDDNAIGLSELKDIRPCDLNDES